MRVLLFPFFLPLLLVTSCCWTRVPAAEPSAATDHAVVQALLRIPESKLKDYPKQRAAVLRHLSSLRQTDPARYVSISSRLAIRDNADALHEIMNRPEAGQEAIDAANLLLKNGKLSMLAESLRSDDERAAAAAATIIGSINAKEAAALLKRKRTAATGVSLLAGRGGCAAGRRAAAFAPLCRDALPADRRGLPRDATPSRRREAGVRSPSFLPAAA